MQRCVELYARHYYWNFQVQASHLYIQLFKNFDNFLCVQFTVITYTIDFPFLSSPTLGDSFLLTKSSTSFCHNFCWFCMHRWPEVSCVRYFMGQITSTRLSLIALFSIISCLKYFKDLKYGVCWWVFGSGEWGECNIDALFRDEFLQVTYSYHFDCLWVYISYHTLEKEEKERRKWRRGWKGTERKKEEKRKRKIMKKKTHEEAMSFRMVTEMVLVMMKSFWPWLMARINNGYKH